MDNRRPVSCPENESLASYLWNKRQEMAAEADGISDRLDMTLHKAYCNICESKSHIRTIKDLSQTKEGSERTKRYLPQKNSVSYALLITLYRGTSNSCNFMRKQELIDATEASGLSKSSDRPEKGRGKPGQFSSPRDWYSGWSCMKTLVAKGLVVKSSNPAKYMLTEEGKEAAVECLVRSGLAVSTELSTTVEECTSITGMRSQAELHVAHAALVTEEINSSSVDKFFHGILILDDFQMVQADSSDSCPEHFIRKDLPPSLTACISTSMGLFHLQIIRKWGGGRTRKLSSDAPYGFGQKFEYVYDVILILDDREQFAKSSHGSRSKKVVDSIRSQFKIQVEVRRLPIGDGIWLARHRNLNKEYALDFIVERKNIDDLRMSVRDHRYKDQKLRLLRCGLHKLIYLVEGDPNSSDAAESIKTACFTTEILEGFDVQRTTGLSDTVKRYGFLTQSINQYYKTHFSKSKDGNNKVCPSYDEFVKKCQDLEKMTVSDVFALQLMQVPQVTEEVALAVLDLYPTLLSLARAYSLLEGDTRAQEEMLKNQSKSIGGGTSRNIFKLVWGS
ncbi:Crossover junction endonuclease MUS81 [Acorus calamus]|uniref:Crossover junction endonuclease MUS81 n=1 Tax=Acorus calamus TaxID=4465 RepID=A0AAV9EW50_ACOCL|nr:Crossover junction endonuclease MUS81 [Acorus calamus]